jgi:hypothetical protein
VSWIITHTGKRFDILNPTPDMIDIRDIAHSLARICRFNGHTYAHYSVAQHSILVAQNVPADLRLEALLHDAAEAYIGDIASPIKWVIPELKDVERRIEQVIEEKFGLTCGNVGAIKVADLRALATEKRDLIAEHPDQWQVLEGVEPFADRVLPWRMFDAELSFLTHFTMLQLERAA